MKYSLAIATLLFSTTVGASPALKICHGEYALCAASSTVPVPGKTITVNGKTFPLGVAVCPVLTGDSIADMNLMNNSCDAPAGKVWSLFSTVSSYPQSAVVGRCPRDLPHVHDHREVGRRHVEHVVVPLRQAPTTRERRDSGGLQGSDEREPLDGCCRAARNQGHHVRGGRRGEPGRRAYPVRDQGPCHRTRCRTRCRRGKGVRVSLKNPSTDWRRIL